MHPEHEKSEMSIDGKEQTELKYSSVCMRW